MYLIEMTKKLTYKLILLTIESLKLIYMNLHITNEPKCI
jgi:hypothetical protein